MKYILSKNVEREKHIYDKYCYNSIRNLFRYTLTIKGFILGGINTYIIENSNRIVETSTTLDHKEIYILIDNPKGVFNANI